MAVGLCRVGIHELYIRQGKGEADGHGSLASAAFAACDCYDHRPLLPLSENWHGAAASDVGWHEVI